MTATGSFLTSVLVVPLVAGLLTIPTSPQDQPPWPFGVTPSGQPAVNIRLAILDDAEFAQGLTLRHELVYNGISHTSRLFVPEIQSYLVSAAPGQFTWRTLEGTDFNLTPGQRVEHRGRIWVLAVSEPGCWRIASLDGAESYLFAATLLVELTRNGRTYRFNYDDEHRIRSIADHASPETKTVLTVEYEESGSILKLHVGRQTIRFKYGKNFELLSCKDDSDSGRSLQFSYRDGLLHSITTPHLKRSFQWDCAVMQRYFVPHTPFPPVVVHDGRFAYVVTIDHKTLLTRFQAENERLEGSWKLDLKLRTLELTFSKH